MLHVCYVPMLDSQGLVSLLGVFLNVSRVIFSMDPNALPVQKASIVLLDFMHLYVVGIQI